MDTSFTFVTALTPATGKTKGAPKFSKLSADKLKESKPKTAKNPSSHGSKKVQHKKNAAHLSSSNSSLITNDSSNSSLITNDSSCTSIITNDLSLSLKSCSESLHFSSDRSIITDHDKKATKPGSSSGQTTFKKIIHEVHAGLEKITFRRKKLVKSDTSKARKSEYYECLEQISSIKIDENVDVKLTSSKDCDIVNSDKKKSCSDEEFSNLEDDMLNLSLEKITTKTKKSLKNNPVNKKLFDSLLKEKNNSTIIDGASTASKNSKRNALLNSDSSPINIDEISPILRISVAPFNNVFIDSDDALSAKNVLENQISPDNDRLESLDNVQSKDMPAKEKKTAIKPTKAKDNKKNTKVLSEVNNLEEKKLDEKEIKTKGKQKENVPRPKSKKTKKKDSFIVSDASSAENESISVYHKFISENIKFDVIKTTTPRSKFKKNSVFHDDGIFTPFIIPSKRLSSESEPEYDPYDINNVLKKSRYSSSEEDICISNIKKNIFSSSSSLYSNEENKPPSSAKSELPKVAVRKKQIKPQLKKTTKTKKLIRLNSFSDSSPTESSKVTIDLTSSPSFTPGSSAPAKKKITPITFKLKNLNKLTPARTPSSEKEPLSFLRSLSTLTSPNSVHPDAEQYRKSFKKLKEQLAKRLFVLFNKEVFDNRLPEDLKIEWNARMRSSSGLCYNKRIKTIGPNLDCLRVSRIALSTKIIESPERLRDTLIHELCHAAAWIIDNKADGHGPCWKSWTNKAMRRFPELPPIKRCHNYSIQTKFKYRCVNCGYTIGRHSKSLNLDRKRCGYCYGRFELLINHQSKKATVSGSSPKSVQVKPLSKFALFVKENYGKIKSENIGMKHGDVMKILSKNFAETKN